jgi:hypothetical protein
MTINLRLDTNKNWNIIPNRKKCWNQFIFSLHRIAINKFIGKKFFFVFARKLWKFHYRVDIKRENFRLDPREIDAKKKFLLLGRANCSIEKFKFVARCLLWSLRRCAKSKTFFSLINAIMKLRKKSFLCFFTRSIMTHFIFTQCLTIDWFNIHAAIQFSRRSTPKLSPSDNKTIHKKSPNWFLMLNIWTLQLQSH